MVRLKTATKMLSDGIAKTIGKDGIDLEDIRYLDLFDKGDPKITVEIAPNDERMFIYATMDDGSRRILVDADIDGTIDKTITPGTAEKTVKN